jgi:DNA-binding transcriptional ArsR family regulator
MKMEAGGAALLEAKAEEAARMLAALANTRRLMALCHMLEGEKSVGQLAALVGLAPTALSQHLARMRDMRLVETRREGQTILYRLASPEVTAILETLHRLYCAPPADPEFGNPGSG